MVFLKVAHTEYNVNHKVKVVSKIEIFFLYHTSSFHHYSRFGAFMSKNCMHVNSVQIELLLGSYCMYWSYYTYCLKFFAQISLIRTVKWHFFIFYYMKNQKFEKFSLVFKYTYSTISKTRPVTFISTVLIIGT